MTSEEILQNIQSATGINRVIESPFHKGDRIDLIDYPLFMWKIQKEEGEDYLFQNALDVTDANAQEKMQEKAQLLWNPHAIRYALWRWILMKPSSTTTKQLIWSELGLKVNIESVEEFVLFITEHMFKAMQEWTKWPNVRRNYSRPRSIRGRGRTTQTRDRGSVVDIDISAYEAGTCNYTVANNYSSIALSTAFIDELRECENAEIAEEHLKDYIQENYAEDGPSDSYDHDYEDHDQNNESLESDNTDYQAILEEIL